jgi:transposase
MERSTIQLMAKRGKSQRQIAQELGRNRRTIARALHEPSDRQPAKRRRASQIDPYREQIVQWVAEGLSTVRMLELVRADPAQPYAGSRSQFGEMVRRIRQEQMQQQAMAEVPVRFEGLPGEYLQVDWGEVRQFPFLQQAPTTRYFLACRLKYSRWVWVRFTRDMRQETLFRGLVDCLVVVGWVPWVLVFDNMKTVTSGRDSAHQPIWTAALLQLAGEFGFHPQACDPGAGNQKGSVEALVKWVKGNFLVGRAFLDDADLDRQVGDWQQQANTRPSAATGLAPLQRLSAEAAQGGILPATAQDYGLLIAGQVSPEALVAVHGNRYSVPVVHVGAPVIVRLHPERVRIWRDLVCVAEHARVADGRHERVVDPAHYAPLLARKPRAAAMLYRDVLLRLGGMAPVFLRALSHRHRTDLTDELQAVYSLYEQHGAANLQAAMALATEAGVWSADALAVLLAAPLAPPPAPHLTLAGLPGQREVDRRLSVYERWVQVDEALPEAAS